MTNNQPCPQDAPSVGEAGDVVHQLAGIFDWHYATRCGRVTRTEGDVANNVDLVTCPACLEAMRR